MAAAETRCRQRMFASVFDIAGICPSAAVASVMPIGCCCEKLPPALTKRTIGEVLFAGPIIHRPMKGVQADLWPHRPLASSRWLRHSANVNSFWMLSGMDEIAKRFDHKWIRIALYYAVALGFSFFARIYWQTSNLADPHLGVWGLYRHLLSGIGPFIGALLVWTMFRPERRTSFGGTFPPMGLAMLAMPAIVLGTIGIRNPFGIDPRGFGVHIGVWIALYAILEETGWRGYLQGEFRDQLALLRYVIVGLFWYAWHLSFLLPHSTVGTEIVNLGFILAASIGVGFVADRTKSIFAAAAFHVIGNILFTSVEFRAFIPSGDIRVRVVLICAAIWLVMLRLWRMRDNRVQARMTTVA